MATDPNLEIRWDGAGRDLRAEIFRSGEAVLAAGVDARSPESCRAFIDRALELMPDLEQEHRDEFRDRFLAEAKEQAAGCKRAKSAATEILEAAQSELDLFHSPEGRCYADVHSDGHRETHALDSKAFDAWLRRWAYQRFGRAPNDRTVREVCQVLQGQALYDGPERPVFVRIAGLEDRVILDLGDDSWKAVEIDGQGWRIHAAPDARFRRTETTRPLPVPRPDGSERDLRRFLPKVREEDYWLLVAWMVAAIRGRSPFPLLVIQGEAGSAKTTTTRILKALVDPTVAPVRSLPANEQDLAICAENANLLAFDNLSNISGRMADALCRLATGGGFGTRKLYSGREEEVFDLARSVILNGIPDLATRHDLVDRAIFVELAAIPDGERRGEKELWDEFEKSRPAILGWLYDVVAGAIRHEAFVQAGDLPRMADFARLGLAVERALGWPEGTFLEAYADNQRRANAASLEADPVADAVLAFMEEQEEWEGTCTELQAALRRHVGEPVARSRSWPKSSSALSSRLRRLAPALRRAGVEVAWLPRTGNKRGVGLARIEHRASRVTAVTGAKPGRSRDFDVTSDDGDDGSAPAPSSIPSSQVPGAAPDDAHDGRDDAIRTPGPRANAPLESPRPQRGSTSQSLTGNHDPEPSPETPNHAEGQTS